VGGEIHPIEYGKENFWKGHQKFIWNYMDEKNVYGFARRFVGRTDDVVLWHERLQTIHWELYARKIIVNPVSK
jgi:hypothetical protein